MQAIKSDEDVLFAWSMVTLDLSEDESCLLLTDVIELWITIRGHSIASRLIEDYKEALRLTTKGKNFDSFPAYCASVCWCRLLPSLLWLTPLFL